MNFPVEIWMQILELALDAVAIECSQHDDPEDCDASCATISVYRWKQWMTFRRFAQISKASRAAADKLVLAKAPCPELRGPPIPIYTVVKPLFSKWSPSCGALYPTNKRPQRIRVLAVGGDVETAYQMRDHFIMLHIAAHHIRDVSWKAIMGTINRAYLSTLHGMLEDDGGKARLKADIDLLMRANKIMLTMPMHGSNKTTYKQILVCLKGMAKVWGVRLGKVEFW